MGNQTRRDPGDEPGPRATELGGEVDTDATTAGGQVGVVEQFTETEAREHTEKINVAVGIAGDLVVEAWNRRIWVPLGYASWEDYCREEIRYQLTGESKAMLMVGLRNAGASYRAIGAAAGVSKDTAQRELSQTRQLNQPERITGTDGKTRPATRPEPSPEVAGRKPTAKAIREKVTERTREKVEAEAVISDAIEPDLAIQLRGYKASVLREIEAAHRLVLNDVERVAASAEVDAQVIDLWESLDRLRESLADWFESLDNHRPNGLRVLDGGA